MKLELNRLYILILLSILIFFVGNNIIALTDPDEVFYALTAKEMLLRHEWLTPHIFGFPQFEKPILTYWVLMVAFKVFGVTEQAARFFPSLFALASVVGTYFLSLLIYRDSQKAFWAGLILATSVMWVGMGKTVFTDMIFATFILYAILSFYIAYAYPRYKPLAWLGFYVCTALATLTKGPLGFIIPELILVLFLLYRRRLDALATPWVFIGFCLGIAIAAPWYVYMYEAYGQAFVKEFFVNDHWRRLIEAEHHLNDHWYSYLLVIFGGIFPFTLFLGAAFKDLYKRLSTTVGDGDHLILVWLLVVFLIFQNGHSKLITYILPLFPALALLVADHITQRLSQKLLIASAVVLALLAVLVGSLVFIPLEKIILPSYPLYWISASLCALAGIVYCQAISGDEARGLYVLSLTSIALLIGVWFAKPELENMVSSAPMAKYLPAELPLGTRIVTDKGHARGIVFYSNQPVTVLDLGGKGFFSPHPVPMIYDIAQLHILLNAQVTTYAYLKSTTIANISAQLKESYTVKPIQAFWPYQLVKIEPLPKS